jgi:glycosyltransferase involved in cell wall biosynthesis
MRRLALVMSHATRDMHGAARDVAFCAALRGLGVEARIWRMWAGAEVERDAIRDVPVTFCPADDSAPIPHRRVSAALRADLASFRPEIVLYKGLGYDVCADTQAAMPTGTRHGFIVGGSTTDPLLDTADIVLGEYPEQLERHFPGHLAAGRALVMPKLVDLALAGDGIPPETPEFDIVNVGSFGDRRKNQMALLPLAQRRRIALVGGGPLLEPMRAAAKEAKCARHLRFFGHLKHHDVFPVLRRARMMVHTSIADGLPRATVEAMACGLPVIALHTTIQGGIPPEAGFLLAPEGLEHAARLLVFDDALRRRMGAAARRHVETHHGEAAIAATAASVLRLLTR